MIYLGMDQTLIEASADSKSTALTERHLKNSDIYLPPHELAHALDQSSRLYEEINSPIKNPTNHFDKIEQYAHVIHQHNRGIIQALEEGELSAQQIIENHVKINGSKKIKASYTDSYILITTTDAKLFEDISGLRTTEVNTHVPSTARRISIEQNGTRYSTPVVIQLSQEPDQEHAHFMYATNTLSEGLIKAQNEQNIPLLESINRAITEYSKPPSQIISEHNQISENPAEATSTHKQQALKTLQNELNTYNPQLRQHMLQSMGVKILQEQANIQLDTVFTDIDLEYTGLEKSAPPEIVSVLKDYLAQIKSELQTTLEGLSILNDKLSHGAFQTDRHELRRAVGILLTQEDGEFMLSQEHTISFLSDMANQVPALSKDITAEIGKLSKGPLHTEDYSQYENRLTALERKYKVSSGYGYKEARSGDTAQSVEEALQTAYTNYEQFRRDAEALRQEVITHLDKQTIETNLKKARNTITEESQSLPQQELSASNSPPQPSNGNNQKGIGAFMRHFFKRE